MLNNDFILERTLIVMRPWKDKDLMNSNPYVSIISFTQVYYTQKINGSEQNIPSYHVVIHVLIELL